MTGRVYGHGWQRARGTRPDLWPEFVAPAELAEHGDEDDDHSPAAVDLDALVSRSLQ